MKCYVDSLLFTDQEDLALLEIALHQHLTLCKDQEASVRANYPARFADSWVRAIERTNKLISLLRPKA